DFSAPRVSNEGLDRSEIRTAELAPGAYTWRVGATDAQGKHGPWSDAMPFTLHAPGEGPGVDAASADGVLQLRWREGDADQRYHFQLARTPAFDDIAVDRVL